MNTSGLLQKYSWLYEASKNWIHFLNKLWNPGNIFDPIVVLYNSIKIQQTFILKNMDFDIR